jgi:hypothetical protein
MVLEARDYGFIGLKLKDLIFHEVAIRQSATTGTMNIHRQRRKDCGRKWRLAANQLGIKTMIGSPRE